MSIKNNFKYHDKDKYEQLLKVSDPQKVFENAVKYFDDPNIELYLSTLKNKKYMIINKDNMKKIHFVHIDYHDFTKHNDLKRREAYLNRAYNIRGKWMENKYSPNNLSIALLWN